MTQEQTSLRSRWVLSSAVIALAAGLFLTASATQARAQSGQTAFGQVTVEPALNLANGDTIFLLTPNHAPFPSKANPTAVAPLYLTAYPSNSSIDPGTLNCQPSNCDHVNVLPFPAPSYPNGGATCANYGLPAGACGLLVGHDHMVGKPPTGDFNVAWHVILVVFTPKAFTDNAINVRLLTYEDIENAETNGDVFEVPTNVVFNCSIVSAATYYKGVPLGPF